MASIFISYRRSDSGGHTRSLAQDLERYYPGEIFRDVDVVADGDHWDRVIQKHLEKCAVLLAVIGPDWLTARDPDSGQRRLDIEDDWVRRELETAFALRVPVIPVLVGGAERLHLKHRLPSSLQPLVTIEPREISARDAVDDVRRLTDQLSRHLGRPSNGHAATTPSADSVKYLRWLESRTARIDIRGLATGQKTAHSFPIEELYTPLTTLVPQSTEGSTKLRPVSLGAAVREFPRLVLVGDPGAGKSTFLRRIAHAATSRLVGAAPSAHDELFADRTCPFPLLASAAAVSSWIDTQTARVALALENSPEYLVRYFEAASMEQGWELSADYFRELFQDGCLLLIDGLDEAPDRRRRKNLARLVERVAEVYPKLEIVATTRPSAFGGEITLTGFASLEIQPLDTEAIGTFVSNWSRLIRPEDAESYARGMVDTIGSRSDIAEMAGNPVMLTALAVLHWNERRLPDRRNELYDSILKWLVRAREDAPQRLPADRCFELVRALAFAMQTDARGRIVEISPHAASVALSSWFPEPTEDARYERASQFLAEQETSTGILIARHDTLRFWHLSFQEYLAAHLLAVRSSERQRLLFDEGRLYSQGWRETVLLLAGILRSLDKQLVDEFIATILSGLGSDASLNDRARCAGLIGAILGDLASSGYELSDARWPPLVMSLGSAFSSESTHIDIETRLEAALALERFSPALANQIINTLISEPMRIASDRVVTAVRLLRAPRFGGDYLQIRQVGADHIEMWAAEASGHGASSALVFAELQAFVHALADDRPRVPNEIVRALNVWLCGRIGPSRFVTVFHGVYDTTTGLISYCNGGCIAPVLVHGKDGGVEQLETGGVVLGLFDSAEYDVGSVTLEPGDTLAIFSDGVVEVASESGEEYGVERFVETFRQSQHLSVDEIASLLFDEISRFASGHQRDDRTLLLLRRSN